MSSRASPSPFVLKPKYTDFKAIEASRPPFDRSLPIKTTQAPSPGWKYGQPSPPAPSPSSTESLASTPSSTSPTHISIDPSAQPMISNYRLLVSAIPRPISFISTISSNGSKNLAPFSYFQIVDHDPPTFVVGFSARPSRPKDTRRNLLETGECVISLVTENIIHAANATSLDVPYEVSEWVLSGLTPAESETVKPERVQEAMFSIEGKLLEMKELDFHGRAEKGEAVGALAIIEGTRFWVREGAMGEDEEADLEKLRPLVQLGGISYGRLTETFELPRGTLDKELKDTANGLEDILESGTRGFCLTQHHDDPSILSFGNPSSYLVLSINYHRRTPYYCNATHVNFEARNIALEHFEFIPKHAPDGSRTSNCRKSPHKCSWGWIDFKLDHLARSQRLRCNCVSATSLRVKTQNLHLGGFLGFYWEWAMDPARFDARQWAIYRLLHMDKPSVRRILIIVHWKQMQEIPASEHAEVENRFQAVGAVMEKGLAGLEIEEAKILRPGQKARWTDWTAPEIRFQRCPCSWEEKPEADAVYYCRRELNILE
ncbi:hypothetical protein DL98DRAFT_657927 [Cadophora sp. DSE1049]|nr:hypothetical protein DL98DRAFT_657927 [Cadophora sp. DSE1049]